MTAEGGTMTEGVMMMEGASMVVSTMEAISAEVILMVVTSEHLYHYRYTVQ